MTALDRPAAGERLQSVMDFLLRAGVVAIPVLCLAGTFLLTAGTDESFLVLHARGLAEHGRIGEGSNLHSSHTLSTSGPYTAIASLLSWVGRGSLQVVRLLSPLSVVAMIFILLRLADRTRGRRDTDRWIVPAAILVAHGLFMLGSQAYGEVLATTLVFTGTMIWTTLPPGSWRRPLAAGLLFGLAAACRLNCLPAFVALTITWITGRGDRRTEFRDTAIAIGTGLLAFAGQWGLFVLLAHDPLAPSEWLGDFGIDSESEPIGYLVPRRLGYYVIAQDHLALVLAAGITVAWACWARRRAGDPRAGDVLLAFAWVEGLAWLAKAPIPHLRYLWPSLASFAAVGGLCLAAAFRAAVDADSKLLQRAVLGVALAGMVSGYLEGARILLHGESDLLSFEYQRATHPTLQYGPFKHLRAQREMVRLLESLPADQAIATFTFDTALALETRRSILPIHCYYLEQYHYYLPQPPSVRSKFPRWLVITPMVNRFPDCYFTPRLHAWVGKNCRLEAKRGPYLLYEVVGEYPPTNDLFVLDYWESPFPGAAGTR